MESRSSGSSSPSRIVVPFVEYCMHPPVQVLRVAPACRASGFGRNAQKNAVTYEPDFPITLYPYLRGKSGELTAHLAVAPAILVTHAAARYGNRVRNLTIFPRWAIRPEDGELAAGGPQQPAGR